MSQEGGRREGRRRFSRIPTHAAKVPSRPARWKCFPASSRTASFPTPCLGPASAPRRPGFLPQFPSRLRSARRPCTGRVLTPRPPRAPPWVRASSPALEPVPRDAGGQGPLCHVSAHFPASALSDHQRGPSFGRVENRGQARGGRGRARTTLARASRRRGGFGGRRPRAAETTQAQGALRRRRWGD